MIVACITVMGNQSMGAERVTEYFVRSSADSLQAYWKDDELIAGINVNLEGLSAVAGKPFDQVNPQVEVHGRYLSVVVIKSGKSSQYRVPAYQTSDDTVYPYQGTVYCKVDNTRVSKLDSESFKLIKNTGNLWIDIINQPLSRMGWKVFGLWDEGLDEYEPEDHLSETCKVQLTDRILLLKRSIDAVDLDNGINKSSYVITGLKGHDPLVISECSGKFERVSQKEYERMFFWK